METLEAKWDVLMFVLKGIEEDLKGIRDGLMQCRAHCDATVADQWGRIEEIERKHAVQKGVEKEQRERREREDLCAQKGMHRAMTLGVIVGFAGAVMGGIAGQIIEALW